MKEKTYAATGKNWLQMQLSQLKYLKYTKKAKRNKVVVRMNTGDENSDMTSGVKTCDILILSQDLEVNNTWT